MSVSVIGGCGRARAFGLSLPVGRVGPLYFRTTHSASKLRISAHPSQPDTAQQRDPPLLSGCLLLEILYVIVRSRFPTDWHKHKEVIMDWTLEVVVLPVSDIERSIAFYRDQIGFALDHDTITPQMHVTQLTPTGSGCSIVFGDGPGMDAMEPGSMKGLQLVVADAYAAREELIGRGVEASEITTFDERDGGTFFGFSDPDGNTWAVQQIKARAEKPLIPVESRGRFGEESGGA